jgi:hypothetical protein
MSETRTQYGVSVDGGERFRGFYGSRTAAIFEAIREGLVDEPCAMDTGIAAPVDVDALTRSAVGNGITERIIEEIQEALADEVGEAAEDQPPGDVEGLRGRLRDAVRGWLLDAPPTCWKATQVQHHTAAEVEYVLAGGHVPEGPPSPGTGSDAPPTNEGAQNDMPTDTER